MLFNLWMGRKEMILSTIHLNCLPHMQCHGNILTDHMKYMYMLLMCHTRSHSYVFPFIKARGGCVYSVCRSAHLEGSIEEVKPDVRK